MAGQQPLELRIEVRVLVPQSAEFFCSFPAAILFAVRIGNREKASLIAMLSGGEDPTVCNGIRNSVHPARAR